MKKLTPWLIIALILRVVLSVTTVHPDIRGHNLAGYLIAQRGQLFSFYDFLSRQPRADPWVKLYHDDLFIYPPSAYLVHGLSNLFFYRFYPPEMFLKFVTDVNWARTDPGFGIMILLLKFPYFVTDFLCLLIIRKLVDVKHRFLTSLLWLFNPITIYVSYMIGQFDIFIALFVLLALYKESPIMLGLAATFKPFPLFFIPLLKGSKPKNIFLGVITYALVNLPYISSPGFRQFALFAPQTDKIQYAKIAVSGSQYISIFFVGLFLIFWWNHLTPQRFATWEWFSAVALLFYSSTHFHPQWLVWASPMLVLMFVQKPAARLPLLAVLILHIILIFLFEPSLTFGLFNISFSLFDFINRRYPADQLASLVRSMFVASSAAAFFSWAKKS